MNYEFEDVQKKVKCSIDKLREYDCFLLKENVNERSITHKLAEYLQQEFKGWNVDCEYNRRWDGEFIDKKVLMIQNNVSINDTDAKTVFPDIIIHKRKTNKNLLVIEVKKSNNLSNLNFDKKKLNAFISDPYNYLFGISLIFNVGETDYKKYPKLIWSNGADL